MIDYFIIFVKNNADWMFSGIGLYAIILFLKYIYISFKNIISPKLDTATENSDMKIVDISFGGVIPTFIDLKLSNLGQKVAFVKEIKFNIYDYVDIFTMPTVAYKDSKPDESDTYLHDKIKTDGDGICLASVYEPSSCYDVILKNYSYDMKVSHRIYHNDVDRITLNLLSSISKHKVFTIYLLSISIVYDEDNNHAKSKKFILPVLSKHVCFEKIPKDYILTITKEEALKIKELYSLSEMGNKDFRTWLIYINKKRLIKLI